MKVVLIKDVKDVGRAHEVVDISDGHALNFLIPKRMARIATAAAMKEAELRRKQMSERHGLDAKLVGERLAALAEGTIAIAKKANEQGHLYDAVGAREIAEAAQLPEDAIRLEKPLKEIGRFDVPVAAGESFGKISVEIAAE